MALRMYRYRIYPSGKQKSRLIESLKTCKIIYNELLSLSINNYKENKKGLFKYDFNKYLTDKHNNIHSQAKQNVSDRVHKSFSSFFRRIKNNQKKGFPRFKSSVKSITYPQSGFKFLNENKLQVSKIGNIPIVQHRTIKGKIKTMTIKRNQANQWFAIFSCEIELDKTMHNKEKKIGIDVGLENFAVLSDGNTINNPRFMIKSENKLKKYQKSLSRKKKGSKNRFKAKFLLAKQYIKVTNQRTDFLHKLTTNLAKEYSTIIVEDLNIKDMVKNHYLAKHINDASWNSFIRMLSYKAVACGGQLIKVDPRNTSKTCSSCNNLQKMPLSNRTFNCNKCGFAINRDLNASINIHDRAGQARISTPVKIQVRPEHIKARVNETGTIFGT